MSVLEKLQIRGIRSFDPNEGSAGVIRFFTPVTLIVGQNGCGKTTIIEALKYVITNSFPPGTDGGKYFVHDPKLGSGYEVMGHVGLELTATDGTKISAVRRMKLTQKATAKKATFQSLEGTMRVNKNGKKVDMSSKCLDMKVEMCRLMGVSDSILNYVIFCHQEDSCWPLDEGKKVKERFDAIFNTTGYMQALKLLDDKDKKIGIQMKEEQRVLKFAEDNMEIVRKKRKELNTLEIQLASLTDSDKKYEEEQQKLVKELRAIEEIEQDIAKHTSVVSVCREKVRSGEQQVEELRQTIKEEFSGDIEDLQEEIQNFSRSGRRKLEEIDKKSGQLNSKDRELQQLRDKQQLYLVQEGKFKQAEEQNEQRLKNLKSLGDQVLAQVKKLKQTTDSHNLNLSTASFIDSFIADSESSEVPHAELIAKAIKACIHAKDSEFNKLKATLDEEEAEMQKKIDELRSQRASLEKEIEMKKEQIQKNKKTADELRKRLNAIEGSTDHLALLDDEEQTYTSKIEQIEKSGVISKCEAEIASINKEIKSLEEKISKASKQVELLQKDKTLTDQIEMLTRQKNQKQSECSEIMRRIDDQLQDVLGSVPSDNLLGALEKKLKELKSEIAERQKEVQGKQREQSRISAELSQTKKELEKKRREWEEWKDQISEVLDDGDFNETYMKVKTELESAQNEDSMVEAAQFLYKKYVQQLTRKPCCPLCKRDFETRSAADALKKDIEKKVGDMLDNRPILRQNLAKLKEKYQHFVELKPSYDDKSKLESEEIPVLEKTKKDLENKLSAMKEEQEGLDETVSILNCTYSEAQGLIKDATIYEQNQKQGKQLEANIAQLERKRDPAAVESDTTLEDVQAEHEALQGTLKAKRMEKDSKDTLRSRKKDELDDFRTKKNKIQEEKLQITAEMQNREALEAQKRELEESSKSLQELIADLNKKIPVLKTQVVSAEKEKLAFVREKDARLSKIREEKDAFQAQGNKLSELKKQIEDFEISKIKFADTKKKMSQCLSAVERVEEEIQTLREAVDELKNEVAAHEVKERDLKDNLKLLQKLNELKKLRSDLAGKEKLLKDAEQRGTVGTRKRELSRQYEKVTARLHESKGKSSELQRSIQSINKELNTSYKNTETEYKTCLVSKTVFDRAQIDIRKFKKALDHAIMEFHKKRMESINKSLKRYWQQVYKGNDIDYIQIRTDDDNEGGGKEAVKNLELKTKKTYSYRVVMIKRGVELDMRGRCSAGQKVLASIIIRIALAEAFSSKCGIIALDEPTTNLDEANISALAETLNLLCRRMSQNRTFQLILITHDQPFMERLLEISQLESFYRITRNSSGYSQIIQVAK